MTTLFLTPTLSEWIMFGCIFFGLGFFIVTAEFVRAHMQGSPEITRKLVHIVTGVLICFTPKLFVSGVPPMLLAASFMVINFTAIRLGLLKGIHGTHRISFGTVYYPFAFFVLILLSWDATPYIITISMLVLALADAAAAIVGENLSRVHVYALTSDKKTIEGSAAMFFTTFGVVYFGLIAIVPDRTVIPLPPIVIAAAAAVFTTVWEAISSQGMDNLTVPLSAGFILDYMLTPLPHHHPMQMVFGIILGLAIAMLSYRMKFLSLDGAAATFLLACVIFGVGGWTWTLPMVVFFVASSILSKEMGKRKPEIESLNEKSHVRDAGQVAANGGVAGALMMLWYMVPEWNFLYVAYLGAIAAVTADTWGTEIGSVLSRTPRSITSWKTVPPGTSGGISVPGLMAGLIGALLIASSGADVFLGLQKPALMIGAVVAAGMIGTLVDSLVGASFQARYECPQCHKATERRTHCGAPTVHVGGAEWITNDVVNWMCAAAGCAAAFLIYH